MGNRFSQRGAISLPLEKGGQEGFKKRKFKKEGKGNERKIVDRFLISQIQR